MKKVFVFASVLAIVALCSAPAFAFLFQDDFEAGIGNWTQVSAANPMVIDASQNVVPAGVGQSVHTTKSASRIAHALGTDLSGYFSASWYIYDAGSGSTAMTRTFGEMRSYSGGSYGAGSLNQVFACGKYNSTDTAVGTIGDTYDGTKYQGRILYGANKGWFNLSGAGSRSEGWHLFSIERTADGTMNFSVDGVLGRSFTGATAAAVNVVDLGFGTVSTTSNGDSWYDGVSITDVAVPEPGSLLVLGSGLVGVLGMLRRRSA